MSAADYRGLAMRHTNASQDLAAGLTPADWTDRAACRDGDPELHFPLGGERGTPRDGVNLAQEHRAKQVCRGCEVKAACLAWALGSGQDSGIWGGLNERERRRLRQPVPAARHGWSHADAKPGMS